MQAYSRAKPPGRAVTDTESTTLA